MEKHRVNSRLEIYVDIDGDTIEEVIKKFQTFKEKYNNYDKLYLEKDAGEWELWGERDETEEELEERRQQAEAYKQEHEDQEYANFLKLRERFKARLLKDNLEDLINKS